MPKDTQWSTDAESPTGAEAVSRNSVMTVYMRIKRKILSGEFQSGGVLPQLKLARDCRTSRGPVREALRLLQREGLIEAETNQRARVASFTAHDLEQVSAAMILNVAAAISSGAQHLTTADVVAITAAIDCLEALAEGGRSSDGDKAGQSRQRAFRRLVVTLCKYGGSQAAQIVDALFDRVAIFRQMGKARSGEAIFPLPGKIDALRDAVERRDASAMALNVAELIEGLAHFALGQISPGYEHPLLDSYVALVRRGIPAEGPPPLGHPVILPPGMTISVRGLATGSIAYTITPI